MSTRCTTQLYSLWWNDIDFRNLPNQVNIIRNMFILKTEENVSIRDSKVLTSFKLFDLEVFGKNTFLLNVYWNVCNYRVVPCWEQEQIWVRRHLQQFEERRHRKRHLSVEQQVLRPAQRLQRHKVLEIKKVRLPGYVLVYVYKACHWTKSNCTITITGVPRYSYTVERSGIMLTPCYSRNET